MPAAVRGPDSPAAAAGLVLGPLGALGSRPNAPLHPRVLTRMEERMAGEGVRGEAEKRKREAGRAVGAGKAESRGPRWQGPPPPGHPFPLQLLPALDSWLD